ncbi:MAG: NAD(P)H-binding protein, partial [Pseudomonadota bacterium]|nr:NAD(P)H-binding protein [Pseudomonadota bacterium]
MSISIIAGSTGLVGSNILSQLCNNNHNVIALSRKPISVLPSKATELIVDFDSFLTNGSLPKCDHIFICLGTTIKIAGSKDNFRRIDIDYPLGVAKKALKSGAKKLTLISTVGANSSSKNFYLGVKGELEDAIINLGYDSVNIFRPSFLIGSGGRNRALSEKI